MHEHIRMLSFGLGRPVHRCRHRARPRPTGPVSGDQRAEVAKVNIPAAVLIWLMVIPMLLKSDLTAPRDFGQHWRGIGVTLFIN